MSETAFNIATTHVTPAGLRCVHLMRPGAPVAICGVAVRAGSRNELPGEEGLAHFVEHTIFKGTARRRSSHIINRMEAVGGELNAYTTKEETFIYSVFPAGNFRRAAELIADLVINSRFPDAELDREREVVAEEIDSYLDNPSEAVFDDFDDLIYQGTPLGHNILGNSATLATFNSASCRSFIDRYYTAPNMVFFYIGTRRPDEVFAYAERTFAQLPTRAVEHPDAVLDAAPRFDLRRNVDENHQAHTVVGAVVPSLYSPRRHAFALLNNIIGGPGMNSRLNVILRERRGLVYSVDSSIALYSDTGLMTIYFGCNPDDLARCRRLVANELARLADAPLSSRAVATACRQYLGQMVVASASVEQSVLSAARSMLFYDRVVPTAETRDHLLSLTPADLLAAATAIVPSRLSTLTLG